MDTRTRFALASLATWRLTHLIAEEDGPADVVVRVRARLGESQLGALMDCFACTSMWTALPLAAVTAPRRRDAPLVWLALSGSACLLQRLTDNQGDPHVLWPEAHPDQDRENDRVAAAARAGAPERAAAHPAAPAALRKIGRSVTPPVTIA